MKNLVVKVDKIGLNASHLVSLGKEEAVREIMEGGIAETHKKDKAWAEKAFDQMEGEVKKAEAAEKAATDKQQAAKDKIQAAKDKAAGVKPSTVKTATEEKPSTVKTATEEKPSIGKSE